MPKLSTFKGRSRWPLPVYVARLQSGDVARISFWSPADKPIDIARGRAVAAYQCGEDEAREDAPRFVRQITNPRDNGGAYEFTPLDCDLKPLPELAPLAARVPAVIVSGEVEYAGETFGDPMAGPAFVWPSGEAPRKARKAPAWHALALAALERGDAVTALAVLRQAA